ncbi:Vesicle-associated membrane protein 724 [Linum perenne]
MFQAIERGENITNLVDKTENLRDQAQAYKRQGTQIRRKMWYQNMKIKLVVLGILLLLVLIIWLSACGGFNCTN